MDYIVHGVTKRRTRLSGFHSHWGWAEGGPLGLFMCSWMSHLFPGGPEAASSIVGRGGDRQGGPSEGGGPGGTEGEPPIHSETTQHNRIMKTQTPTSSATSCILLKQKGK